MNENLFTDYIFMNMCPLFMVQHIPSCKLQTRPNIQHPCSRKVRRTVRLQTGAQPPFANANKQSPEGATDCQHGMKCHPFGVPFNDNHFVQGFTPLPVFCRPRRGLFYQALYLYGHTQKTESTKV